MAEEAKQYRNKRKRKKTFLTNARKYGKRGYYGRGTKLDEDTYQYFIRIMEAYKEGFPTEEERVIFVNNVFEQTDNQEITCSCNQFGCRVIETLLPFANDNVMEKFITAFGNDLRPLCSDRFATHVAEALIRESTKRSLIEDANPIYSAFVTKISRFLLNNMEDYMWDTYGNHTMRSVFYSIAGIPKEEKKAHIKTVNETTVEFTIPDSYKEIVQDYAERLLSWPQFVELPYSELTSGFLQVLIKALQKIKPKLLNMYVKRLNNECFAPACENGYSENNFPPAFMSTANMMLLETALQVAAPKYFTQIYAKCFKGMLYKLACSKSTNFAVQKLFNHALDKTEFEEMFEELNDNFKKLLELGHSGVVLSLGQACKRLGAKQGSFMQNLMKSLDCFEPQDRQNKFVLCLCKLQPFDTLGAQKIDYKKEKLSLHGTLMLQLLLEFNKPIKLVNALLAMDPYELKSVLSNTMGSHITDSYVKSQYVGEKSREQLLRMLKGTYQELAATKYGSRTFDALWNVAGEKVKMGIMDELSHKDGAWAHTEFGKIIANKVHLHVYKKSKEEWRNSINKTSKAKNLMADVLGT